MLTDCEIIRLDAHAILARIRLTVKAIYSQNPSPNSITSHLLFHLTLIPGFGPEDPALLSLKHQPIHPKHPIHTHQHHLYIHYYPLYPNHAEIRHQRSKYAFERTFQVWGKSKLACSYVQANHASSAKLLRSPALSTSQAIGASLLSLARCGGLWDYPRALKADLLHPTATDPDQLGSPQPVYTLPLSFGMQAHGPLGDTRFEPPISVAHSEIPRQVQDTVEENPTGSRTTTTDTHTAAISSTPTPTHISHIGSDDILTVLLGGSLPGTNTAGNTEAHPGQQWLTVPFYHPTAYACDSMLVLPREKVSESTRDLPMRSEMQEHSYRAMPIVTLTRLQ
ncbi:hypothetical protein BASA83_006733 [Batrachochytrium salamandrivorans]|nr:hypothetical protein BASA83_006733 [Batrachochytrium salamandrivorans]